LAHDFRVSVHSPVARQKQHYWKSLAEQISLPTVARKQRERDRKELGTAHIFPGHTLNDLLPPVRHHFLIKPSYYEFINRLTH
jgi:hypothetical protein